jgi:asparaginyl-tRNA synthetase
MKRTKIAELLQSENPVEDVLVKGWVRTRRDAKHFSFIEVNDGSCLKNLQVIADSALANYEEIQNITTGSAVAFRGGLVASQGAGQQWELQAKNVMIIGHSTESYPLQKKRHSDEFLRSIAHLRPRTNKYGAAFRIRSHLAFAVHRFFNERGFIYLHAPIITGSDCEGAGELFRVTTFDLKDVPRADGQIDFSQDFFGSEANLTVSGQLAAEMFALALGDVYTFGPTFRAENSNTRRHAAEFWMVEPEMAFCDLQGNMDLGEALVKQLVACVLQECRNDLDLFARFVEPNLLPTLENIATSDFVRLPYQEAVKLLLQSQKRFEYEVAEGKDLQTEHERYLTEVVFQRPVIVYNYPKQIKPFYMRINDDQQTVAAMDVLVPNIGELIGGSQREERLDVLESRMDEMKMPRERYWWYLDARRYGTAEHSGFGLGFERLLMLVTGIANIRDVIPFPRTPSNIEF